MIGLLLTASRKLTAEDGKQVMLWGGVLIFAVIIGFIFIYIARRYIHRDQPASTGEPFTLHDLRMMHAAGQITDEEFQRARDAMIGRVTAERSDDEDDNEHGAPADLQPTPRDHGAPGVPNGPDNENPTDDESGIADAESTPDRPDQPL